MNLNLKIKYIWINYGIKCKVSSVFIKIYIWYICIYKKKINLWGYDIYKVSYVKVMLDVI